MLRARPVICVVLAGCAFAGTAAIGSAAASPDPLCVGAYGDEPPRGATALRFGVDPGLAGSGVVPLPAMPDVPDKALAAVRTLRPAGKELVVRLNRMFWSDGEAGIREFQATTARYAAAGFDVELQVRYHPAPGQAGDLAAWVAYVRHVVDAFGANPRVVAMTITNEANLAISPNTSDGYYQHARDALVQGIIAGHDEARRRGFGQLRFGFTFAYRFLPTDDADFFSYLAIHGGRPFLDALDWLGLDFYPGTVYPPVLLPGDSYRAEMAQALGVLRRCLAPLAGVGAQVPIWITENGAPTPPLPGAEQQQLAAMRELVTAANDYRGTYNVTDYRWFNLRDNSSSSLASLVGPTFSADGLLREDYTPKPSFAGYRELIAALGADRTISPGLTPAATRRCRPPPLRMRVAGRRSWGGAVRRVVVYLGTRRVLVRRGRDLASVMLAQPPARAFSLTVVVERRRGRVRRLHLRYRLSRDGSCRLVRERS